MGLDRERIMAKIGYIKEQVASIGELLKSRKKEDILMDPWLVRGLKYSMQTAVEAMIDLAYHIAAKKFGHAPGAKLPFLAHSKRPFEPQIRPVSWKRYCFALLLKSVAPECDPLLFNHCLAMFRQAKAGFRQGYPLFRQNWLTWSFVGSKIVMDVVIAN